MNRLLSVLLIAAAASLFLVAASETQSPAAAPVDLRIDVAPTSYGSYELLRERHPDTYTCSAMLFDEKARRVFGRVEVIVRPGEELTKTTTSRGLTMTMKGRVDAARTGAVADVTVFREGALITHQQSRVQLARAGR
jgi:hypothetical protein